MKLLKSFGYALRGIFTAAANERNFRIHTTAAVTVAVFAYLYGVTAMQCACLVICVCAVLSAELLNTALEAAVDLASPEISDGARLAKDCAAGAVLVFAVGAVLVACCIFSDMARLADVFFVLLEHWIFVALFTAVAVYYIFCAKNFKKR